MSPDTLRSLVRARSSDDAQIIRVVWRPIEGRPLKFIYMDEAGTSRHEPLTVVVALLIDGDTQFVPAERALEAILETVPARYRAGFVIHAKTLWGRNSKYREHWPEEDRNKFLCAVASIPRMLGIPVVVGFCRRTLPVPEDVQMEAFDYHHLMAFVHCATAADDFIKKNYQSDEVAMLVAENVNGKRRLFKDYLDRLRKYGAAVDLSRFNDWTQLHWRRLGKLRPVTLIYQVERIRDTINFVEKRESPLLQLADVFAWGCKRFYIGADLGREMMESIRGCDVELDPAKDWKFNMCGMVFVGDNNRVIAPTGKDFPKAAKSQRRGRLARFLISASVIIGALAIGPLVGAILAKLFG